MPRKPGKGLEDLFRAGSEMRVMLSQSPTPRSWRRLGALMPPGQKRRTLEGFTARIEQWAAQLPGYQEFLDQYCAPAMV